MLFAEGLIRIFKSALTNRKLIRLQSEFNNIIDMVIQERKDLNV
jgi:hypothetical protein